MPEKKAAKKTVVKHADPKHQDPKDHEAKHHEAKDHKAKDLRRAYEHLGRVEILQRMQHTTSAKSIPSLVTLAERELGMGHRKDAADLLRAAEHFSFAALASVEAKSGKVSEELEQTVAQEVEHLTRKANEHWDKSGDAEHHASVKELFRSSLEAAATALDARRYRQALELARGAEALAHVKKRGHERMESGTPQLKLPRP